VFEQIVAGIPREWPLDFCLKNITDFVSENNNDNKGGDSGNPLQCPAG
jgi:hypothetical protein